VDFDGNDAILLPPGARQDDYKTAKNGAGTLALRGTNTVYRGYGSFGRDLNADGKDKQSQNFSGNGSQAGTLDVSRPRPMRVAILIGKAMVG